MKNDKYYIIKSNIKEDTMMLGRLPDLPDDDEDDWLFGKAFTVPPEEPIIVYIDQGEERSTPLSFYKNTNIANNEFIASLLEIGVDNIVTYDAILESWEGDVQLKGYKAFNIIGLINAAGLNTKYASESREGDASIEKLDANQGNIKGAYIFRLAESWDTIVIHEKVKKHLESKVFVKDLIFTELDGAFIL